MRRAVLAEPLRALKGLAVVGLAIAGLQGCDSSPVKGDGEVRVARTSAQRVAQFEQELYRYTEILASDEFEGRAPASAGEEKTVQYLRQQFEALGLEPGNGDSFFQRVPVAEITTATNARLELRGKGYSDTLAYGPVQDMQVIGYGFNQLQDYLAR